MTMAKTNVLKRSPLHSSSPKSKSLSPQRLSEKTSKYNDFFIIFEYRSPYRSFGSPLDSHNMREEYIKSLQFQIAEKEKQKRSQKEIGKTS